MAKTLMLGGIGGRRRRGRQGMRRLDGITDWMDVSLSELWRTVWRFLKKLEIELPYDPAIPLLGTHTKETRTERDTCTPMFITALFIIARTWKQPRCSISRQMDKKAVVHIHNGILLSH